MTNPVSTVFVGAEESVFVTRTQNKLIQQGIPVVVVDPSKFDDPRTSNTLAHKLWRKFKRYRRVRRYVRSLPKDQTAIVHFLSQDCFWLIPVLASHFDRVVGLAYGSDVLRRNKSHDFLLRFGLKRLDVVAATNDNVLDELIAGFPFLASRSPQIIRFGLPGFDELLKIEHVSPAQAKTALGYDDDNILISLGYSASPGQRQIELINFFASRCDAFGNYVFVVPVQYGSMEVVSAVVARCAEINSEIGRNLFIPLTEFHDIKKLALMRRATDVLIKHTVSDAFSGTVQEVLYAGNLVLAADHLPYRKMPGFGSAIRTYGTLDDAAALIAPDALEVWRNEVMATASETRAQLHEISSWDAALPNWRRLIDADPE